MQHLRSIVRKHLGNAETCHDYDHTLRVLANAEKLSAGLPEADPAVVRCAVMLHDIARPVESASRGSICHAQRGAEMAAEILSQLKCPAPFIQAVSSAIRTHRFRDNIPPETLEGKIVYDADKLDSLGAAGIGRAFLFAGHQNARLHNTRGEALAAEEYSINDTAYREYLVKLSRLPESMQTAPGHEEAYKRIKIMDDFFAALNMECNIAE